MRLTGAFNMIMEQTSASELAGLDLATYWAVMRNYSKLSAKRGASRLKG